MQAVSAKKKSEEKREKAGKRDVPDEFALRQSYPNPVRSQAEIRFDVPEASPVRIAAYDVMGREVATLLDKKVQPGRHRVRFAASELPAGVYLYRMQAKDFASVRRFVIVK